MSNGSNVMVQTPQGARPQEVPAVNFPLTNARWSCGEWGQGLEIAHSLSDVPDKFGIADAIKLMENGGRN